MKYIILAIVFFASGLVGYSQEKPSAVSYFNRGIEKFDLNDKYGAIADFTKAIELKPLFNNCF